MDAKRKDTGETYVRTPVSPAMDAGRSDIAASSAPEDLGAPCPSRLLSQDLLVPLIVPQHLRDSTRDSRVPRDRVSIREDSSTRLRDVVSSLDREESAQEVRELADE